MSLAGIEIVARVHPRMSGRWLHDGSTGHFEIGHGRFKYGEKAFSCENYLNPQ